MSGGLYDLSGLVAFQGQGVAEPLLLLIAMRKAESSAWFVLARLARIDDQDFVDCAQEFHHPCEAQVNSLGMKSPLHQRNQRQSQDAVEGMHADLAVGPMKHR